MTKSTISIIVFTLFTTIAFANSPVDSKPMIDNDAVTLIIGDESNEALFYEASYNEETQDVYFRTASDVSMIQVVDEQGELVMMLPIGADQIYVSLADLSSGNYAVTLTLDNAKSIDANVLKK